MVIDFNNIKEEALPRFKGGEGHVNCRAFNDGDNKIMSMSLEPGCTIGYHKHEGTCEIIHIISGTGHFIYDGTKEPVAAGSVHYCPDGHSHSMHNDGDTPLEYIAIVVPQK